MTSGLNAARRHARVALAAALVSGFCVVLAPSAPAVAQDRDSPHPDRYDPGAGHYAADRDYYPRPQPPQYDPDFALGIGYAHVSVGNSDSALHSLDALRWDGSISFSPFRDLGPLRLGGAVGFDMVLDNSQFIIVSNHNGLTVAGSSQIPFIVIEPEVRLSWRQYLDARHLFFIEPGIGGGGAIAHLDISPSEGETGPSLDEWDANWSARAFVNIGFRSQGGFGGLQLSYMRGGELDFGSNARGELEEFYIGIFGALQF